ncbi:spindle and kinetochore-associated 2-like isoform X1 [Paramuricea clavata]|uniref:Protein FAM33A n=1 Tax=Paramuricea clavata TaxID=317549 RepID=A0A6S7IZA3_PARCT|nr:spindle and kinetochore-associated 2-like isoform X1 [Paramuricea clavata]
MAVEAATNRLEALVEKIDSDLDYAVLKLSNEFSEKFEDGLPSEINPVELIERLRKAKQEFKVLMKESDDIESKQKAIIQALCRATSEQMNKVLELQRHAGMQPNANTDNEELVILRQECGTAENMKVDDVSTDLKKYGKLTTTCRSGSNDFDPVTEEEFMNVSDLVRGRSKLEDVNQVYNALFTYFQKHRKVSRLTLKDMTKLGLKVSGATGSAKLKVLRTLNIIEISKDGSVKMV